MKESLEQTHQVLKEENLNDPPHVVVDSRFRQDYVIEDDEFVAQRINEVKAEIDRMSEAKVLSYRLAFIKAPDQCDDRFLLKCLRSEYFHPIFSARKAVNYWDKRLQLFGLDRGFLPLYQTDAVATPEEKEWLKVYYCSGEKDIKGRTIICYTNHHLLPTHPAIWYIKTDYILRAMWLSWEAGSMDDEAQKKGSVTIIDLLGFSPHHWDTHYLRTTTDTARRAFPFKPAQIHLLSEPAWMGYFLIMYQNIIGHKLRSRFVSHRGDRNMVIEKLKSEFGIPASVFRNFPMPSDAPP